MFHNTRTFFEDDPAEYYQLICLGTRLAWLHPILTMLVQLTRLCIRKALIFFPVSHDENGWMMTSSNLVGREMKRV